MSKKDVALANSRATDLLEQGLHPLQLSSLLSRSFRTMRALKSGSGQKDIGKDLASPWFAKKLMADARRFNEIELDTSLAILARLDEQLKSSQLNPSTVLGNAITKIALQRPSSAASSSAYYD